MNTLLGPLRVNTRQINELYSWLSRLIAMQLFNVPLDIGHGLHVHARGKILLHVTVETPATTTYLKEACLDSM